MNFLEIANARQSCRKYDPARIVEEEKLIAVLEAGRLSPSACNSQPYHLTVCCGNAARAVADHVTGMGLNGFAKDVPVMIVISEDAYTPSAALASKRKGNDFRSMDIGILSAYLTAEAEAQGLASCILGWFDDKAVREICHLDQPVRLIITLGYAAEGDPHRTKKRKSASELITFID